MRIIFFIGLLCSAVWIFSQLDQPDIDKYMNHIRDTFNQVASRGKKTAKRVDNNQQQIKESLKSGQPKSDGFTTFEQEAKDTENNLKPKKPPKSELPETGKNNKVLNYQYDLKKEFNADKGMEKELEKQPEMKLKQDHYQLIWENLKEAGEILNELHDQSSPPARTFSTESESQAMIKKNSSNTPMN